MNNKNQNLITAAKVIQKNLGSECAMNPLQKQAKDYYYVIM